MNVYAAGGDKLLFPGSADQLKTKKSDHFFCAALKVIQKSAAVWWSQANKVAHFFLKKRPRAPLLYFQRSV